MSRQTLVGDLRVGWRITRAEYVRRLRRLRGNRPRLALVVLSVLLVLPVAIFLLQWVHGIGQGSRDGLAYPVVAATRNLMVPVLLTITVFGALNGAQELGNEHGDRLLLRTVSNRAQLVGEVLPELLGSLALYLLPVGVFGLAFGVGAGTPGSVLTLLVAATPLLLLGLLLGYVLAYGFWIGLLALPISVGARRVVGACLTVVMVLGSAALGFGLGGGAAEDRIVSAIPTGPPPTPLGWYADLLFLGTPLATPLSGRTLLAAVLVVGTLPLAGWTLTRLAPRLWYATPNRPDAAADSESVTSETPASATIGRDGWFAWSRTVRIAMGYGRRVRRRPDRVVYVLYYLLVASFIGLPAATSEVPVAIAGVSLVVLGGWLAGGVFCLNLLGDEGGMLSQLLLAPVPASTIVHARLLAGVAVSLPIALLGVAIVSLTTPAWTALLALLTATLVVGVVVASAGSALAVGAAVPQFETGDVFGSVEAVAPSTIGALFHAVLTLVLTAGALNLPAVAVRATDLAPAWSRWSALGVFTVVLLGLADGGRRYATTRLATHGQKSVGVSRPLALYRAAGLALLSFVVAQLTSLAVFRLGVGTLGQVTRLVVLFLTQYAGFAGVALGYLYATRRGRPYLDTSITLSHGGWAVGGLAGGLGVWLLSRVAISRLGLPAADQGTVQGAATDPRLLLVLVVLVVFVNAPVEELLYRNVIQKSLAESLSPSGAILVTSGLFALAHVPAYFDPNPLALSVSLGLLFVLSVLWGVVYAKTESVVVTAVVHGCYNATLLGAAYLSAVG